MAYKPSLTNALSGASTGATIGSLFGPIGTAIGGGLGSLAGLVPNSSGVKALNPLQQQVQDKAANEVLSLLQGKSPQGFLPIAERAQRQFYSKTVPALAERFASMGTGGSHRSSAFQGAIGQAGSDLESQLGELEARYGQNLLSLLLGPALGSIDLQRQGPSPIEQLGSSTSQLLPLLLAMQGQGSGQLPATNQSTDNPYGGFNGIDFNSIYQKYNTAPASIGYRLGGKS